MPEIKLTTEEEKVLILIKQKQLSFKNCKDFLELFCLCIENGLFVCKNGKKIIHFDNNGMLRQIETQQIDFKK